MTSTTEGLRPVSTLEPTREYLRSMWVRRELALALPVEQVRSAHKDTLLGNLWHLANPALTIGIYYLVFGKLLKADRGIDSFLLWLAIGVFVFRFSQSAIQGGATSLSGNVGLIRAMRFPRALLPVSVIVGNLLTFAIELSILGGLVILSGHGVSRRWLAIPAVLAVQCAFNLGGAFITARLNETFRDVQQLIPFAFTLLRYLSGVMFPIQRLISEEPGQHVILERLISLNPLLSILDTYRWALLGEAVDPRRLAEAAGISLLILWFGFRYFRAAELRYGRG